MGKRRGMLLKNDAHRSSQEATSVKNGRNKVLVLGLEHTEQNENAKTSKKHISVLVHLHDKAQLQANCLTKYSLLAPEPDLNPWLSSLSTCEQSNLLIGA